MMTTSRLSPTTTTLTSRLKDPLKNEGRTFRAWCGGTYIFELGEGERLKVRPYQDPWVLIKSAWDRPVPDNPRYEGLTWEEQVREMARYFLWPYSPC